VAKRIVARCAEDLRKFDALEGRFERGVVATCIGVTSRRAVARAVLGVRVTSFTGGSFAFMTC
jgi:hypothetical protein